MARHLVAKFSDESAHHKYSFLVFTCAIVFLESTVSARPTYSGNEFQIGQDDGSWGIVNSYIGASWPGAVLSLGFLLILATLLALCGAGGCCGNIKWFGRSRQEPPLSFSNPMTEPGSTMMVPISQIDVRALELDPIVFEPLPTVRDLTPLNNKLQHDRGQSTLRNPVIPIVPFNSNDASVYAHDWFEEPLNNFPRSNIEYVKEIGKGWFGQVIEAEARDIVPFTRKMRVIVKLLREDANGVEQMRFLDESRMYRDGNHGNILKLLGHSIEKLPFLLIMEFCPQGDLKSFLISNITRAEFLNSQGTIIKMALDVARGMEWLHNAGFVHPDLACRNCQVGSENRVVIGDCGLGTQNFKDDYHWSSNIAIPLRWTAPETLHCTSNIIQILKVTESSNIWTLGVVIWEICEFGKLPYFELADDEVIARVIIDKNYFLGRPTLPCMSAKEELYKIMTSCWEPELENRPRLYTIVRQIEEIHKAFTSSTAPSPKDEFESKWEQLGVRGGLDDDKRRKKNVSFLDLESQIRSCDTSSLGENEAMRNVNMNEETSVQSSDSSQNPFVTDQEKDNDMDQDGDEEHWTKKIERGDITQKVLEKSQSVQDLMVLTHFEQGDMGELDSLVYIGKPTQQSSPQDVSSSSISKDSNSSSSMLRKSCSEPAIDSLSLANSSHTLTPASVCDSSVSQSSTLVPQSPSYIGITPNISGVDISVIPATPNPPVDINVIHATPLRSPSSSTPEKADSMGTNGDSGENSSNSVINRKLHFKFDSSPAKNRQRQTSTPLRSGSTPSPRISDFGDREDDVDYPVFDSSGHFMEGTFNLSPISQHYISSSFNNTTLDKSSKGESSVLFGASDDHELGSYQGVKSQLKEKSETQSEETNESENDFMRNTAFTEPKIPIPRRLLFANEDSASTNGNEINSNTEHSSISSDKTNGFVNFNVNEPVTSASEHASVENDDFWEQQLKSLQLAANSTRQLFQTGLNDPEERKDERTADDKRFVEDIEADVEELGSLVLHDLEEPEAVQTVIKETREAIKPDDGVSAKLAFQSNSSDPDESVPDQGGTSTTTGILEVSSDDCSLMWDINNSIEIRKGKSSSFQFQPALDRPNNSAVESESDVEEAEDTKSQEFKPSKWNQSLVPSRSAIKSPEQQQPKSSMKKSVSFERKKTQLVYEYPPPPEEVEEKAMTAVASSSIPSYSAALDWELTQEELENSEWNHEDWDDEVLPKQGDPMDVYRISGFSEDNFQVRGSSEPFEFSPSTLGELRHTRDRLRLDLSRGEANFLDNDESRKSSNPTKLDSGVGSSTNVSPFNNCDILTKRSKTSD